MPSPDLSDYVTVAERIAQFRDKHPEGSLRPADPEMPYDFHVLPDGTMLVIVVAAAYRSPDDARPGIGMASEPFPGRTPYTQGSELMNAETSAWGRAIVAALAADTSKAIASQEEVRNRSDEDREAAGLMTKAQQREHAALRKLDHPRPAERGPAPDPWQDQAAGDWQEVTPEDRPGSSIPRQHKTLYSMYTKRGMTDKTAIYADLTDRTGRAISSARDLSFLEANRAVKELSDLVNGDV